jgi:L-ascorbate metabolism protein UlaG (beta-lactamase superfamily)
LTWLGHSSFLLRLDGRNILLDPFLSDYATLVPPLGPKRYIPPGLPVEKLPGIDLRVISKNHYDHLDRAALELLPNKDHIPVIVPLKLTAFISDFSKFSWGRCQPEGSSKPFESIAEG